MVEPILKSQPLKQPLKQPLRQLGRQPVWQRGLQALTRICVHATLAVGLLAGSVGVAHAQNTRAPTETPETPHKAMAAAQLAPNTPPPSEPDYQIGKTTPPVTPDNADLLRTGLGLGVVLLLMLGLLIVIKRAGFGAAKGGRQFYKILAVSSLGPKEKISLIEVGDHWLLVGITSHSINTLHTMPKDSIDLGNASNAAASFAKMLEKLKAPHNKVNS